VKNPLIIISLSVAISVVFGYFIQNGPESSGLMPDTPDQGRVNIDGGRDAPGIPDAGSAAADIVELDRLLKKEIRARQALEQKLEKLSRQMTELGIGSKPLNENSELEQVAVSDQSSGSNRDKDWFDEQALIDGGMNISQAGELKHNFEQLELERLYLRDQSIREEWNREKLNEAMRALSLKEDEFKNQLSESDYDAYLYASGQTNRVEVTSVFASAEAGTAGILSGDHIVRYDNQRIYNGFELRQATTSGSIEEMVALEVERDGETLQFYLPRGPLGIRMNSVSVAP
jgi:hypothetical protein